MIAKGEKKNIGVVVILLSGIFLLNCSGSPKEEVPEAIVEILSRCNNSSQCMELINYVDLNLEEVELRTETEVFRFYGGEEQKFIDTFIEIVESWKGEKIDVIQKEIKEYTRFARITLTLKVERSGGSFIILPIKIELKRVEDQWIIKKIRIME